MDNVLVLTRTVHFAATISTSGTVIFCGLVAGPAFGPAAGTQQQDVKRLYERLSLVFWTSIALALLSGAIWFCLVAANIGDRPLDQIFADDLAWNVLADTGFGQAWLARLLIAVVLAAMVQVQTLEKISFMQVALAASLAAGLAWAGHGAATPGIVGYIHLSADALHLIAVGAWVGGLVPFTLLLRTFRARESSGLESRLVDATRRFSTVGLAAVGAILATGAVNTWNLIGSADDLLSTDYGRLLVIKLLLFATMVLIAAVNRWRLSPILATRGTAAKLERNSLVEAGFGLVILFIVGALGILAPALDSHTGH